ncbi:MAG: cell division protein [Planctomycetota bacterium]|nr:MAG: cell division protein [Planctomycetota bacterium]REJ95331.1 MAG: cell division protein [Planctomycetota bacterium]REK24227.1 MAG: cell division protein [Planctomycetota bacterium]REK28787.1 MAG: cell division protein [Planctomycetota bacterium]
MALTGTYLRSLDEKQRIAVPKRLRDAMSPKELKELYVGPEVDHALALFSPESFERRAQRLEEATSARSRVTNYLRLYYSQAERVEVDSQGRIRLPERLVEFAKLQQEVVLLGVHDHVEIWDKTTWQDFFRRHSQEFDQLAAEVFN